MLSVGNRPIRPTRGLVLTSISHTDGSPALTLPRTIAPLLLLSCSIVALDYNLTWLLRSIPMQQRSLKLPPLKLHTRTTIVTSGVLVVVFAIIAIFSDLAITKLSDQQERQQAQLLATRIADTVEHHIKRLKVRIEKRKKAAGSQEEAESTTIPDWADVQEEIEDTIAKNNPQIAEVRVFHRGGPGQWSEPIRIPSSADGLTAEEEKAASQQIDTSQVVSVRHQGTNRFDHCASRYQRSGRQRPNSFWNGERAAVL